MCGLLDLSNSPKYITGIKGGARAVSAVLGDASSGKVELTLPSRCGYINNTKQGTIMRATSLSAASACRTVRSRGEFDSADSGLTVIVDSRGGLKLNQCG
jgi:hypothetical protein